MYLYVSLEYLFINIIKCQKSSCCFESTSGKQGFFCIVTELQKSFCKTAAVWCSLADSLRSGGMGSGSCRYLPSDSLCSVLGEYSPSVILSIFYIYIIYIYIYIHPPLIFGKEWKFSLIRSRRNLAYN